MKKIKQDTQDPYTFDSDDLGWCWISGSYRDQGCVSLSFKGKNDTIRENHKGGDFKISPQVLAKFLREIGVTLHGKTQRKHTYIEKIELKPWSEFEQEVRKPTKTEG
jgi:hypothetical protein